MLHGVIIAGGSGKRLWPISRRGRPKYLIKVNRKDSLLQQAASRLRQIMPYENIVVITNKEHAGIISRDLPKIPKKNIIAEPVSKNTAPAICTAAAFINKKDPDAVVFIVPADHFIKDKYALREAFGLAALIARMKNVILTIGIKPTFASTGFGYIKTSSLYKRLMPGKEHDVYKIARFIEKPPIHLAKRFFKSKRYLWNGGVFIARAKVLLDEFRRYQPRIYNIVKKIEGSLGTKSQQSIMGRCYKALPNISMDYAVMEKTKLCLVIKAGIVWDDVGSLRFIEKIHKKDSKGNTIVGDNIALGTTDSVIIGKKGRLIATLGLDNIAIIQTDDATLVCPKEKAEDVKSLIDIAYKKGLKRYL